MSDQEIHSLLGASSAHRFMACPGSVALIEEAYRTGAVSRDASTSYADEGTRAHKLAADILQAGCVAPSLAVIKELEDEIGKTKAAEMVKHVKTYVGDVWHAFNRGGPTERAGEIDFRVEHKFKLADIGADCFGTCDCVLYKEATRTLWVWDFKYGAGVPVEAEGNVQLLYYALGALGAIGDRVIDTVVLTIVQPRCDHPDGPVRRWEVSLVELLDFEEELRWSVCLIKGGNASLVTGKHCKFCPVKHSCPELHRNALMVAGEEFEVLEVGGHTPLPDPASLSSEELGRRLTFVTHLQLYAGALYTHATREAERGRCPEGWKLVEKQARRKWIDEERARSELVQAWGATNTLELKSPAQIEKLIGKGKFGTYADRLVKKESSGLRLVPASHEAKAVACLEFEDLTSDDGED